MDGFLNEGVLGSCVVSWRLDEHDSQYEGMDIDIEHGNWDSNFLKGLFWVLGDGGMELWFMGEF